MRTYIKVNSNVERPIVNNVERPIVNNISKFMIANNWPNRLSIGKKNILFVSEFEYR